MQTVVIGAGPTGLFTALALARRGRRVTVIDRDPGPPPRGVWLRKGVMQFGHAHSFRGQVVEALLAEMPEVLDALIAAGATVAAAPGPPARPAALHCRRSVFERALWQRARREPRVRLVADHVDGIVEERGRVVGVRCGASIMAADLVIDASGRASRAVRALRGTGEGADCGATYVGRLYRMRADATPGPTNSVIGLSLSFLDYAAVMFLHDSATFTVTLIHSGTDARLHRLRHNAAFEAAVGAIPALSDWVAGDRAAPLTPVLAGGRLYNRYRGQLDGSGRPVVAGLISVGDAVCSTTPLAGRGVALALMQARELVALLDEGPPDLADIACEFDTWCTRNVKPWFIDHRVNDADRVRRWSGQDVDLSRQLPSDLIVAAAAADPQLNDVVGPYVTMDALPDSLAPAQGRAREIFAAGWRPPVPPGPSRDELISVVSRTPAVA